MALPASAGAAEVQLGQTTTPLAAPTCPTTAALSSCLIVEYESTALETISDGTIYPTTVTAPGVVTAFSIGVSGITSNQTTLATVVANENKSYGGPPEAAITVLRQVGKTDARRYVVAAESSDTLLTPYLGSVAEFPLSQAIPVVPGEVVALTVPTWAPILSYGLSTSNFGYRQSRTGTTAVPCTSNPSSTAELAEGTIGEEGVYGCPFFGTRAEYSATEVVTPTPTSSALRRGESLHPRVLRGHKVR